MRDGERKKKNSRSDTYTSESTGTVCHRQSVTVPLSTETDSATLSDKMFRS